ncbi:MAG: NAD(P)/FAD-dependent oxidoreductase [Actinomycetota bacterium]|nr:NAD(P)/FAD-dependent oxidoreductase [Actinomycetota bacterium]
MTDDSNETPQPADAESVTPTVGPSGSDGPSGAADPSVVIIGAGPAGLTSAFELMKAGHTSTIIEADDIVGGISRSVERDGYRFDIGGHRFFTKVPEVEALWHEILPDEEFLLRPRMSRIYYKGKYYDYPIKPVNALLNLGPVEAVRCVLSYLAVKVRPPKTQDTLEDYIVANYGRRLFDHFFKTYNEKVWGVPASAISADWGAQRIKGMSIFDAVWEPIRAKFAGRRKGSAQVTSLIEEFQYPKYGPGQMWEVCTEKVVAGGSEVLMETRVERITHANGKADTVFARSKDGAALEFPADEVISSMPFPQLLRSMDPQPPAEVLAAADDLGFRDFLTVALVVPEAAGFPDNWIYIHSPDVKVGRIQNFGSWSPYLVKDGNTCLGLEYFVFEGDDLWTSSDEELIERGQRELAILGLVDPAQVQKGYVVRQPKAYPVYDDVYTEKVAVLNDWITSNTPNVHPVGRNGMHKYNNQDHSMLTAMLTVENILGKGPHDIWTVNVDEDYHEESGGSGSGTGREAPVLPRDRARAGSRLG